MLDWSDFAERQPLASKMIVNSVKKNRLSHAYLIQGEAGTGKKTFAKILAMTIFCENRVEANPCGHCHACRRIASRNHPDVHWIEPDGTTIKNEQIDYLRKEFAFSGVESTRKLYILTQADRLTTHAANRLLKFLEEPNITSTAILLTERSQAILPTIRSRCQIIDLRPLTDDLFRQKLLEAGLEHMTESRSRLLSALTSNIEEAIALHKESKVYDMHQLVIELLRTLQSRYEARFLFVHDRWLASLTDKADQALGLDLLLLACRDLIHYQEGMEASLSFFTADDPILEETIRRFSNRRLVHMLKSILDAKEKWAQHVNPTLVMEQLILQF